MLFIFLAPMLIRHLWQFKTVVFLHWYILHAILLGSYKRAKLDSGSANVADKWCLNNHHKDAQHSDTQDNREEAALCITDM
jgi:hypothetical protein